MNLPLVHAHLHTSGSLLDGVGNIKNYIKKAKEYEHPAICCTDHGSAISTYYFFNECKKEGIKPIIGCEFYITTDVDIRVPNKKREIIDRDKHLIVLVKNQEGYKNFCKLIHFSYTQGFYFKPRITYDMLWKYKEGLIISSACAGGPVSQLINCEMYNEADQWFKKFVEEFGDDFYAEIQFNEIYGDKEVRGIDQKEINEHIIKLAKKYNTKLILTGDVHYVDKEDVKLQEILINCMYRKSGKDVETAQNFMHAQHLFYQSSDDFFEFNKKFEYNYDENLIKECFKNSLSLVDKCNFEFDKETNNYPEFNVGDIDHKEFITNAAYEGLENLLDKRMERGEVFSQEQLDSYAERLEYEIKIISEKGYIDYFLIYQDMITWAKNNDIQVGVARGCFLPDSKVKMANGLYKEIQNIKIGDKIIGKNGKDEVDFIWRYDVEEELIELTLENNKKIRCTFDHEILTENRGYVKAIDLNEEDNLKRIKSKNIKITKKEKFFYKGTVIDLKVKNDPSYNIEDVVVHNSAAGALVSYALGITQIDPMQFGLYFERFLNPARKNPPDIDCLSEDSLVLLPDGTETKIINLKEGDQVQTNEGISTIIKKQVREIKEKEKVFKLTSDARGEIILSENHIIPIMRNGEYTELKVKELKESDFLIGLEFKLNKQSYVSTKIEEVKFEKKLVDISLDKTNLFYAKSENSNHHFLVHNCDFQQGGREKLRKYLESKYGEESVYGVMTQFVFQVKSALQDVSRGLGKDTSFQSTLMKEITKLPKLDEAKNIREYFDNILKNGNPSNTVYTWIIDNEDTIYWADKLMGLTKNVGTHAGGIVIAPGPIYDYIPVVKAGKEIVTAFRESDGSGHDLSDLGLLKCDILGLKTLNVISGCIKDIKKDKGIDISDSINFLNLKDPKLFQKFNKGNNVGIFQLEGCLDENTLITLPNNVKKKIKDLKAGETIIAYNESLNKFEEDEVISHGFTGYKDGFEIKLEDGSTITSSKEHKFLTTMGWKKAEDLNESDDILELK